MAFDSSTVSAVQYRNHRRFHSATKGSCVPAEAVRVYLSTCCYSLRSSASRFSCVCIACFAVVGSCQRTFRAVAQHIEQSLYVDRLIPCLGQLFAPGLHAKRTQRVHRGNRQEHPTKYCGKLATFEIGSHNVLLFRLNCYHHQAHANPDNELVPVAKDWAALKRDRFSAGELTTISTGADLSNTRTLFSGQ